MIIAIEGMDCSGKTTQAELLKEYLKTQCKDSNVETFHFPNKDSAIGKEIYNYLEGKVEYSKEVVELLHTADKMNKQWDFYKFKNNYTNHIILDRYKLSQYAYAMASEMDINLVDNLIKQMIEPDIRIFLSMHPKEAIKRKKTYDKYESDIKFLDKVYGWYLVSCDIFDYKIIDARKPIEEVHEMICDVVKEEGGGLVDVRSI